MSDDSKSKHTSKKTKGANEHNKKDTSAPPKIAETGNKKAEDQQAKEKNKSKKIQSVVDDNYDSETDENNLYPDLDPKVSFVVLQNDGWNYFLQQTILQSNVPVMDLGCIIPNGWKRGWRHTACLHIHVTASCVWTVKNESLLMKTGRGKIILEDPNFEAPRSSASTKKAVRFGHVNTQIIVPMSCVMIATTRGKTTQCQKYHRNVQLEIATQIKSNLEKFGGLWWWQTAYNCFSVNTSLFRFYEVKPLEKYF